MTISRNETVLASCAVVAVAMLGLSYAAVPLYDMFCRATGYAGTPARAAAPTTNLTEQLVTIRFDSNVDPALPWRFQPDQSKIEVALGENILTFFRAENLSGQAMTGRASFNVAPARAARYFAKIECFCFTEQTLEPGQIVDMPVSFFVDPKMLDDRNAAGVTEFTLSYTFFLSADGNAGAVSDSTSNSNGKS